MKLFKALTDFKNKELLKFPAFISLLAANSDNKLDETEKKAAIKLSHIKTYSSVPLLAKFYKEADNVFENNIQQLDKDLPIEKAPREAVLKNAGNNYCEAGGRLYHCYASKQPKRVVGFHFPDACQRTNLLVNH